MITRDGKPCRVAMGQVCKMGSGGSQCSRVDGSKLISISLVRQGAPSCLPAPGRRRGNSWSSSPRWDLRTPLKVGAHHGGFGGLFCTLIQSLFQVACKNLSSGLGLGEQRTPTWELTPHQSGAPRQEGDGGVQGWTAGETVGEPVYTMK